MAKIKQIINCLMLGMVIIALFCGQAAAKNSDAVKSVNGFTQDMELNDGLFPFYWDSQQGHIYMLIKELDKPFLMYSGLTRGIGSNDIGIDRNQLGRTRIVRFEKIGQKILLHQVNLKYRANTKNSKEKQAVEEAFATSVLWSFKVQAQTGEKILIHLTPFLLSDQQGVALRLIWNKQGNYRVDAKRSAIYKLRTKNFPENSEFDSTLTFAGSGAGNYLRQVTPTPDSLTIRQHISFIQLPDNKYTPRAYNVNSGYYPMTYLDYATPIESPLRKRFITRHRLEKKSPTSKEVKDPIIYYVDPAVPEPVRSALLEGAGWWNEAFEAAGFKNAFQVKILPEGADPMDARYNVINWVHRSTRGWSYGMTISDPRTGEIIKGHVSLGSLRVRQDYLIAQGLLTPFTNKEGNPEGVKKIKEMALARIRQLSAHEVGHTLGLSHNYAASGNNRASVMDYPHPLILLKGNKLDFSRAYDTGIGDWDKVTIKYGYSQNKKKLQAIIDDAFDRGLVFVSDPDSNRQCNAHAGSHLWDNGADSLKEFHRLKELRRFAIIKFSANAIPFGQPMSNLEEVLVPLYYSLRYQVDAVAKLVGGMNYGYFIRGQKHEKPYTIVAPERQLEAIDGLLETLTPRFLALPESVLSLIPPKALNYRRSRESFPHHTGQSFDAVAMTEALANHTLRHMLHPQRAARLVEFNARDGKFPSLQTLLNRITSKTIKAAVTNNKKSTLADVIKRRVNHVYIHHLMLLTQNKRASEAVRAGAMFHLSQLENYLLNRPNHKGIDSKSKAHYLFEARRIQQFLSGKYVPGRDELAKIPPGSPI